MNRYKRFFYSWIMSKIPMSGYKRADFMRRHGLMGSVGENCLIQNKKLPLYSNLVFLHNNVIIASNVGFVPHDFIHAMLNKKYGTDRFIEKVGCIEVMDNVFIGSGTRILYGTRIGSNVIIGSDSLVNKDIPDNSVYAGVPARFVCTFDDYVKKAKAYSDHFRSVYGLSKLTGVDDALAAKLYEEFLNNKNH